MKKNILVLLIVLGMFKTIAQNINGVSTNPSNPINPVFLPWANLHLGSGFTHDPFLNTFNWEDANGKQIDIGEMQVKLLEKVEELTLYIIAQQKQIDSMKVQLDNK